MKLKNYLSILLLFLVQFLNAQVGIGTTSPSAILDIRSSNQTTPANTDGILIPKVDAFPVTNPTAAQQGMLVYLTTTSGTNVPGFYYWDNTTTSWIGITSSANSDADWFKVGTTTAPTAITDNMFHSGNVAIGKNTAVYPLEIQTTAFDRSLNNSLSSTTTNTFDKIGILNTISGTSNDPNYGTSNVISNSGTGNHFGTSTNLSGTGSGTHYGNYTTITGAGTGQQIGVRNTISNSGNNLHYGVSSSLSGSGTGDHYGNLTDLNGTGTGEQHGSDNLISNSGNNIHYGNYNALSGTGSGSHFGFYANLSAAGTGRQYGIFNNIVNTGDNIHYGTYNNLSGTGIGNHFGSYNNITGTGTGLLYGNYTSISNTANSNHFGSYTDLTGTGTGQQIGDNVSISNSGSGTHYGFYSDLNGAGIGDQYGNSNAISNTGSGIHYGNFNTLSGTGTGQQYGISNSISNSGNATHYGSYSNLTGTGTGIKYGNYNLISATAGGTHYGVYSEVLKSGANYAGYFLGNVSIGTTAVNNYILPPSRGTNGQIMQTDGIGNVTWQSLNSSAWQTTGNSGTTPASNFFGTTDDQDIVFKRNGVRAGFIGNPNTTTGNKNTAFGANSLTVATGTRNTAIGTNVMPSNSTGFLNVSMGDQSMFSNTQGSENTAMGVGALYSNTLGVCNVAIGRNVLTSSNGLTGFQGSNNTGVGYVAMKLNTTGAYNSAIGRESLYNNLSGNYNVGIGYQAGFSNSTGNNSVFIGNQSGYNEVASNRLYIENSNADADNALIYGEFDNNIARINGQIQIGNPAVTGYTLPTARGTNGDVLQSNGAGSTAWVAPSTLSITETDPQVSSATSNTVPKWNGTTLVDGVIKDDGTNVGIGTTATAGNKLEVAGKTKTTDFQMTTGASANYILQSDATGNASWVIAPNNTLSVARTNLSANQALTTGGWQLLNFNTVVFDLNSEFNTGTNRFVASKTGYYQVNAGYHTDNQSNMQFYSIGVRKNGALYQQTTGNHINNGPVSRTINCLVYLLAGDYVEIYAENYQSGVTIDSYSGKTYFEVQQIR